MPGDKIRSVAELESAVKKLRNAIPPSFNEVEKAAYLYAVDGALAPVFALKAGLRGRLSKIPDYLEDIPTTLKELSLIHQTKAETLRAVLEGEGEGGD